MPFVISDPVDEPTPASTSGYVISDNPDAPAKSVLDQIMSIVGGPKDLARGAGLTARAVVNGVTGIPAMLARPINSLLGMQDPRAALDQLMTSGGLPEPQTALERVGSEAVSAATGAGGVARTAAALPGDVAATLAARPAMQVIGGASAGASGQSAREAGLSPSLQFAASLLGGAAAPMALDTAAVAIPGAARFIRAGIEPFTEAGQRQIAGSTLNRLADDPAQAIANMRSVPDFIPGSSPSAAQAARDTGLASVERAIAPYDESANNAARVAAFTKVAGTPQQLAAAQAQRASQSEADYAAAGAAPINFTKQDVEDLAQLTARPAFKDAVTRASRVASDMGMPDDQQSLTNPAFLHLIKMGLDQSIESAKMDTSLGKFGMSGMMDTKTKFLDILDRLNPAYSQARQNFADASGPIDKMEALQDAFKRSQLAAPDAQTGLPMMSQAGFKKNVLQQLGDIRGLSSDDADLLRALGMDLDRSTVSAAGKPIGSNTMQNLATKNAVGQTFGADLMSHPFLSSIMRPLAYASKVAEPQINELLQQAMADPSLARKLMSGARPMTLGDLVPYGTRQRGYIFGATTGTAGTD